jgi:hypothetical protein
MLLSLYGLIHPAPWPQPDLSWRPYGLLALWWHDEVNPDKEPPEMFLFIRGLDADILYDDDAIYLTDDQGGLILSG